MLLPCGDPRSLVMKVPAGSLKRYEATQKLNGKDNRFRVLGTMRLENVPLTIVLYANAAR